MAGKTLIEILKRYEPDERTSRLLLLAEDTVVRADKDSKLLEIKARFPKIIDKRTLYRIEDEIREAYQLNSVRLLPTYDSGLFSQSYLSEVLIETERIGTVARGFFDDYEATLDGKEIRISIPMLQNGVDFMYDAKTPAVIEGIIRSEFGTRYHVTIERGNTANYFDPVEKRSLKFRI